MSCNLDHVLYDKQNLDIEEKDNYADAFYEAFKGKEFLFIDFIRTDAVNGVPDTSFKGRFCTLGGHISANYIPTSRVIDSVRHH